MKYENRKGANTICDRIDSYMEELNDLCKSPTVVIKVPGRSVETLSIGTSDVFKDDRYHTEANEFLDKVETDIKQRIANLHKELKDL